MCQNNITYYSAKENRGNDGGIFEKQVELVVGGVNISKG